MYDANDIDEQTLAKAAAEALERPEPCWMRDERLYTTHGVTFSWATNSDDLLAESNYTQILAHLTALVQADDYPGDVDDLIDGSVSDWAVGPLSQIFVRITGDDGSYTPVFREAVAIALALRDYPVFDEADYSEREYNDFNTQWEDIAPRLAEEHEHDTEAQVAGIARRMAEQITDAHGYNPDAIARADDQDWWDEVRDAYFDAVAHDHLVAQIPGQQALPV